MRRVNKNSSSDPIVSFVVPCYGLARYLRDCIESILSQSYRNLEVLVMDDCSPDHTTEVAQAFRDPRVKYVRNRTNLGHLRNYNKGIASAVGKYIWLISADDNLRSIHILDRYVRVMETHPEVGYTCCPAIGLEGNQETAVENQLLDQDTIFPGRTFAKRLLSQGNCVIAASGMVRRDCYGQLGAFPLDLPYAGDWFLWLHFALHYDVAYFAQPMVHYRHHEHSMTMHLTGERLGVRFQDGIKVLWRIWHETRQLGLDKLSGLCMHRLASQYAHDMLGREEQGATYCMTEDEFEASVQQNACNAGDAALVSARTWELMANSHVRHRRFEKAQAYYERASKNHACSVGLRAKQQLIRLGLASFALNCRDMLVRRPS